ncbi:MAG: hypothetical protein Q8R13_06345 [bacterium]|nr:hypothetical protein [bacterium]MDZ4296239.1 hypothetical protein [Patescibacteria group bacterium]
MLEQKRGYVDETDKYADCDNPMPGLLWAHQAIARHTRYCAKCQQALGAVGLSQQRFEEAIFITSVGLAQLDDVHLDSRPKRGITAQALIARLVPLYIRRFLTFLEPTRMKGAWPCRKLPATARSWNAEGKK